MKTFLRIMTAVVTVACLALVSCDKHTPQRHTDTSGTTIKAKLMSNWVIQYKGREQYTEEDGTISDVERFHIEAPDAAYYLIRTINPDVFRENYGTDVVKFFQDEQSYLEDDAEYYKEKVTDYLYSASPQDLLFDRIRHGEWDGYLIGFNAKGKITGEYAKCTFTVEEEVPTEAFNKWIGKWTVSGSDVSYNIIVSSSEANIAYYIDGWETGASIDNQTGTSMDGNRDWFETFFEPSNNAMYFVSQYIQTYEETFQEKTTTYNQYFFGNIYYNGRLVDKGEYVIPETGLDIAAAQITDLNGQQARINGCSINSYMTDDESSLYETAFTSMQYYADNGEQLLKFNLNVPEFPLTMVKTSAAVTSYPAMARKPQTKSQLRQHTRLRDVTRGTKRVPVARKAHSLTTKAAN